MGSINYSLKLYTAPSVEPVSTAEAKTHLRVDTSADDTYIGTLISAARQQVEEILKRALVTQTWDMVMDKFPGVSTIQIPRPPLAAITAITYTTAAAPSTPTTFAASNYLADTYAEPGLVRLVSGAAWPADELVVAAGVKIRFSAGYGAAAAVPNWAKQAILLLVGDFYENREDTIVGAGVTATKSYNGVMSLLWPHRIGIL